MLDCPPRLGDYSCHLSHGLNLLSSSGTPLIWCSKGLFIANQFYYLHKSWQHLLWWGELEVATPKG